MVHSKSPNGKVAPKCVGTDPKSGETKSMGKLYRVDSSKAIGLILVERRESFKDWEDFKRRLREYFMASE